MAVALLAAAGSGERLGSEGPKAFVVVAGRPLVEWSLAALRAVDAIDRIVVALPEGVEAPEGTIGVRGGAERPHSVRNALEAARDGDPVLVHDAARPLLTAELAEVVRNLAIREHHKGLSTGEKQMFTRAKKILASELMYALDKDEEGAEQYLDELLAESAEQKVVAAK